MKSSMKSRRSKFLRQSDPALKTLAGNDDTHTTGQVLANEHDSQEKKKKRMTISKDLSCRLKSRHLLRSMRTANNISNSNNSGWVLV